MLHDQPLTVTTAFNYFSTIKINCILTKIENINIVKEVHLEDTLLDIPL